MTVTSLVEVPASDAAYRAWVKAHPDGYVVDLRPLPSPSPSSSRYPVFHRADCQLIALYWDKDWDGYHVGNGRAKLCSTSASALARCAQACGEFLLFCCSCEWDIG